MIKRPMPGEFNGPREEPFSDISFAEEFPTLHDYLTQDSWESGQKRLTSTLLLFVDAGVMKCCINDRDNNRSAFVTATTFAGLLQELEAKLCAEKLDWRTKRTNNTSSGYTPF